MKNECQECLEYEKELKIIKAQVNDLQDSLQFLSPSTNQSSFSSQQSQLFCRLQAQNTRLVHKKARCVNRTLSDIASEICSLVEQKSMKALRYDDDSNATSFTFEDEKLCPGCEKKQLKTLDFQTEMAQMKQELEKALRLASVKPQGDQDLNYINQELSQRIQEYEETVQDLRQQLFDSQIELEQRDKIFGKAQSIVKKLNDECEQLACQLKKEKDKVKQYKKGLKQSQNEEGKLKASYYQLEDIKKVENRLRSEIQDLKLQLKAKDQEKEQIKQLNQRDLEEQEKQKQELIEAIEELALKLNDIEQENQKRDAMITSKIANEYQNEAYQDQINRLQIQIEEDKALYANQLQYLKQQLIEFQSQHAQQGKYWSIDFVSFIAQLKQCTQIQEDLTKQQIINNTLQFEQQQYQVIQKRQDVQVYEFLLDYERQSKMFNQLGEQVAQYQQLIENQNLQIFEMKEHIEKLMQNLYDAEQLISFYKYLKTPSNLIEDRIQPQQQQIIGQLRQQIRNYEKWIEDLQKDYSQIQIQVKQQNEDYGKAQKVIDKLKQLFTGQKTTIFCQGTLYQDIKLIKTVFKRNCEKGEQYDKLMQDYENLKESNKNDKDQLAQQYFALKQSFIKIQQELEYLYQNNQEDQKVVQLQQDLLAKKIENERLDQQNTSYQITIKKLQSTIDKKSNLNKIFIQKSIRQKENQSLNQSMNINPLNISNENLLNQTAYTEPNDRELFLESQILNLRQKLQCQNLESTRNQFEESGQCIRKIFRTLKQLISKQITESQYKSQIRNNFCKNVWSSIENFYQWIQHFLQNDAEFYYTQLIQQIMNVCKDKKLAESIFNLLNHQTPLYRQINASILELLTEDKQINIVYQQQIKRKKQLYSILNNLQSKYHKNVQLREDLEEINNFIITLESDHRHLQQLLDATTF